MILLLSQRHNQVLTEATPQQQQQSHALSSLHKSHINNIFVIIGTRPFHHITNRVILTPHQLGKGSKKNLINLKNSI